MTALKALGVGPARMGCLTTRALRITTRFAILAAVLAACFLLLLRHECLLGGTPGVYGGTCYRARNYISDKIETHVRTPYADPPSVHVVMVSIPREVAAGTTDWLTQSGFARSVGLPEDKVDVRKYIAGDETAQYHPRFNKGHEVSTYLTYLVDNYDNLPDIVVLIHAEDTSWHAEHLLLGSLSYAFTRLDLDEVRRRGFVNLRVGWRGGCVGPQHADDMLREAFTANFGTGAPDWSAPETIGAVCCSQFAITREQIRKQPREQYERSLEWLRKTELTDYLSGRLWERMFQYLFAGREVDCPDERKVYCTLYHLCLDPAQWKVYKAAEKEDTDTRADLPSIWTVAWRLGTTRRLVELGRIMKEYRQLALTQGEDSMLLAGAMDVYTE